MSDDVAAAVRDMIFDGRLQAGERINEVRLAAALGVSRTPLREALAGLAAECAVTQIPRRGWFVRELTVEEVEEIYPIRAYLDPEALRLAGPPSRERLDRIQAVAEELRKTPDVKEAIRLDDDWYGALWEECPNGVLIDLIRQFMRRTRRYELALMRQPHHVRASLGRRARILALLRDGDMDSACQRLRENLLEARRPIVRWLRKRRLP